MPIASPLQRFIDDELDRSGGLISRVVAGTLQLLREARDQSGRGADRDHHAELLAILQAQGSRFETTFLDALRALIAEEVARVDNPSAAARAGSGIDGLALMDESLVDIDIEISRAMRLIDATAEWELRELQTFTSTLTGQSHVSAESNPLRPLVYATALWRAAETVCGTHVQRATLLRLASGVAAGLLKNAWAAATTRLEAQGVTPGTYRTVVIAAGVGTRAPIVDVTRPGALSGLLAQMPSAHGGLSEGTASLQAHPTAPRAAGTARPSPRLESALHQLQAAAGAAPGPAEGGARPSIAPEAQLAFHREVLVRSATSATERRTIELVARIFDRIFSDKLLSPAFRPVFARLQAPCLRVALTDSAAMDSNHHPVWQLLDRIGEAGAAQSHAEDSRQVQTQRFCLALADELASHDRPNAALYRRSLNRLDAFLGEQMQAEIRAAQSAIAALELAERRSVLEQQLSKRLADQLVSVRTAPVVRRFLTSVWAKVVAEAMLRHGMEAEPTKGYIKTVDDLLWSVQLPDHPQSRQRLLALLPGLLQSLRAGMELIAWPRPQQQAVLEELMTIHAEALRPGARANGTAPMTAEQIVQRMREEPAPEPRRQFGDSVIDLSSMETVPADILATREEDEKDGVTRIDRMRAGARMRMFIHGDWSRCQLIWRSDQGQFFLFAADSPGQTHSITRRALERLNEEGLVQALEPKPLLQRAVDGLMREVSRTS